MDELTQRIEAAQTATAELDELENVRETAAELPVLLAQQRAEQDEKAAQIQLGRARKRAAQIIAATLPKATTWRARFDAAVLEVTELIDALGPLESEIFVAAATLAYAADELTAATEQRDYSTGQTGIVEGIPEELRPLPHSVMETWRAIGGVSPELTLLPGERPGSIAAEISGTVQRRARVRIYNSTQARDILKR